MRYNLVYSYPFVIPFLVAIFIQTMKLIIDYIKTGKRFWSNLLIAGGFPSVHSGRSASMTTLVGLLDGLGSMSFAIAFSFSFLFWYDAMNVRYEAGKHAQTINNIRKRMNDDLPHHHKIVLLKERIGHTPFEVM